MKIFCPDCKKVQEVIKDECHIHDDCGEYAWICSVCSSLNVDQATRDKIAQEEKLKNTQWIEDNVSFR